MPQEIPPGASAGFAARIVRSAVFFLIILLFFPGVYTPSFAARTETGTQPDAVLLGNLHFGMKKNLALAVPGAKAGEGDFAGEIILPEIRFAGFPWTGRLEFRQKSADGSAQNPPEFLVRVCLAEIYSGDRLEAVNRQLGSDGFELLAMLARERKLDFIAILKSFGVEELRRRIEELSRQDDLNLISYAWFDTRKISRAMKVHARNLNELLHLIAADTREAEVTLTGSDGRINHIQVIFSLPVLEIQTFGSSG